VRERRADTITIYCFSSVVSTSSTAFAALLLLRFLLFRLFSSRFLSFQRLVPVRTLLVPLAVLEEIVCE
jgi:hypothetical protein